MSLKDSEARRRADAVHVAPAQPQACRVPPPTAPGPSDEADSQADPACKAKTQLNQQLLPW